MSGKGTMMKSQKKCRIVHQSKTIPRELVEAILSRLQVKSLLRFKTVSKQWCNIITSPTFIKLHYERSNYRLHVLCSSNSLPVAKFYTLDLDEERPLNDYFRVERLRVNLKGYSHKESVGSCNGIVCLRNSDGWGFTLLNPATRTHVKLPNILVDKFRPIAAIGTNNNPLRGRNYGLGYDSITDDYKVVKIEQYCRNDREKMDGLYVTCAMVYSLKKNEWLMSQEKFYCLNDRNNGVSYNNALHFLAVTNKPWVSMVSFNLSTRKFDRDLMSLSDVTGTGYASRTLALLKGSLHIMATIQQRSSNYLKTTSEVDLWMMKDYSTNSWCRLAKIVVPLESPRLITYSKSLTQILFCYKRLNYNLSEFFLADLPSGQEKARHCLGAPISPPLPMLQPYVESLVTLKRLP